MSERRKRDSARNRVLAYTAAGVVHAIIIGAMLFNFASEPDSIEADFAEKVDVVKATTVEESEIERQKNALAEQEREKRRQQELERQRLKKLQDDAREEEKRIEDLKKQQDKEREEAAELERQRKEIALKREQELEKQKREEAERRKKEQERLAREQRERQQREERLKREQEELERIRVEKEQLEAQRRFQEQLAADEERARLRRAQERATTLSAKYAALIKQKVQPKITISPDFSPRLSTRMNVTLTSSGDVRGVRIIQSSGNSAYDRAVETAIYASSPLPIPSLDEDPDVNRMFQDLTLNFSIDGR